MAEPQKPTPNVPPKAPAGTPPQPPTPKSPSTPPPAGAQGGPPSTGIVTDKDKLASINAPPTPPLAGTDAPTGEQVSSSSSTSETLEERVTALEKVVHEIAPYSRNAEASTVKEWLHKLTDRFKKHPAASEKPAPLPTP